MRSEKNNEATIQIRMGTVTLPSYLFFQADSGDLILEPGDDIILIARKGFMKAPLYRDAAGNDIFVQAHEKIKTLLAEKVKNRLVGGEAEDPNYAELMDCVRDLIDKLPLSGHMPTPLYEFKRQIAKEARKATKKK